MLYQLLNQKSKKKKFENIEEEKNLSIFDDKESNNNEEEVEQPLILNQKIQEKIDQPLILDKKMKEKIDQPLILDQKMKEKIDQPLILDQKMKEKIEQPKVFNQTVREEIQQPLILSQDISEKKEPDQDKNLLNKLSPAVRKIVDEKKIDIHKVQGTGRDGRILKGDLIELMGQSPRLSERKIKYGSEEVVKMTRLRLTIAKRLKGSPRKCSHINNI